jgi:hypothetical protein
MKIQPKNIVQKLAFEKHSITNQADFQKAIAAKPWEVSRLTARNWWMDGATPGMRLSLAFTLASFLKIKVDDLRSDLERETEYTTKKRVNE